MFNVYIYLFSVLFLLSGCSSSSEKEGGSVIENNITEKTKAFFGDKSNSLVVVVDVEKMKLNEPISQVHTGHLITYTADKVIDMPKVYVVNRGDDTMDVIDTDTIELTKTINLDHHPRSAESMNKTLGLCEVSGMDKPMASIIDINTDEVVAVVGDDTPVDTNNNPNHGGSHATGHPFWLDANHFVLLDRYNRKIITYYIEKVDDVWETTKLNELNTTTSIHQIIPSKGNYFGDVGIFYATAEGSDESYPSIIELKLNAKVGLEQTRELSLEKDGVDKLDMWLHHGDFNPDGKTMYVGSGDGTMFIVDYDLMVIEKTIKAGKGAGHTMMAKQKHLAIVVNHKDSFVTIVNSLTNEKIKDINVSEEDSTLGNTIQAHPKYHISADGNHFYSFLTQEGALYELDLNDLNVTRRLNFGGKPAQGCFVKY